MNNTFEFIGKISPCKETEKFKPYSETKFDSGWAKKQITLNSIVMHRLFLLKNRENSLI